MDVEGTMIIHSLQTFKREMLKETEVEQKARVGTVHALYEIDIIIDYIMRREYDGGQAVS